MASGDKPDDVGLCICKEKNDSNWKNYFDINNKRRRIGKYCTKCEREGLVREFIFDNEGATVTGETDSEHLYYRKPPALNTNTAFQVQSTKTKIDPSRRIQDLKPVDYIAVERWYVIWHHMIVSEIDEEKETITVIHLTSQKFPEGEVISTLLEEKDKILYRIDYPDDIGRENPPTLVLARARSKIGDKGYNLFTNNCETFATFCKCGFNPSHQFIWLLGQLYESIGQGVVVCRKLSVKAFKAFDLGTISNKVLEFAEKHLSGKIKQYLVPIIKKVSSKSFIEGIARYGHVFGMLILIFMEIFFLVRDLIKARKGEITRGECIKKVVQRLTQALLSSGLMILGCFVPVLLGLNIAIEIIIGLISIVVGKAVGTSFGSTLAEKLSVSEGQ